MTMTFREEQLLRADLDRTAEELHEVLIDLDNLADENGRLAKAIEVLYASYHSMLPHMAEKVRDENPTIKRVVE